MVVVVLSPAETCASGAMAESDAPAGPPATTADTDFLLMCECPAGGFFATKKKAAIKGAGSLSALYDGVQRALKLDCAITLEVFDADFEEWAEPTDLSEVPSKGKVRVVAAAEGTPSAGSPLGASPRGVVRVPLAGSSSALEIDRADPANRLGAGGSGVVFKAWRVSKSGTRDPVAVKTLPFGATPAELETFRKEIGLLRRAAGGCSGVCRLLEEPIEQDGQLYLVMKLYAGSLADLLRRGEPMAHAQVVEYSAQIAAGLAQLHGLRIAVLDLKPDNLLVDAEAATLVIADFGISKKIETVSQVFSTSGAGGGTPGFMSPEQCDRQMYGAAGLPADIWALGCVAISMLLGSKRP